MEKLVTTFDTSKKIAEFRDDHTLLAWVETEAETYLTDYEAALHARQIKMYPAYTAQEIADQMEKPFNVRNLSDGRFYAVGHKLMSGDGDTMAEALALLYIKLHQD